MNFPKELTTKQSILFFDFIIIKFPQLLDYINSSEQYTEEDKVYLGKVFYRMLLSKIEE